MKSGAILGLRTMKLQSGWEGGNHTDPCQETSNSGPQDTEKGSRKEDRAGVCLRPQEAWHTRKSTLRRTEETTQRWEASRKGGGLGRKPLKGQEFGPETILCQSWGGGGVGVSVH